MCPSEVGSRSYTCALLKPDLITDEPFPCRFAMVYLAGRRLVKVCKSTKRDWYKAHWREGKGPWQPMRTSHLPWRPTFDAAQTTLNFYANARGWIPVWPLTVACEGEPVPNENTKGGSKT